MRSRSETKPRTVEPKIYLCYYDMTKTYNQLNLEQRYKIETLKCIGNTYTENASDKNYNI